MTVRIISGKSALDIFRPLCYNDVDFHREGGETDDAGGAG